MSDCCGNGSEQVLSRYTVLVKDQIVVWGALTILGHQVFVAQMSEHCSSQGDGAVSRAAATSHPSPRRHSQSPLQNGNGHMCIPQLYEPTCLSMQPVLISLNL